MIPRILEYEDGRIIVTAAAFMQPELKAILDKYGNDADPYLGYVHLSTAPDSPYINMDDEEREETIIFDVTNTMGDFDIDEPLLQDAITKLKKLYTTKTKNYYDALGVSIDKMAEYLKNTPITEGKDGNLSEIIRIHKEGGATIRAYKDIEKQVDEELKTKMRGKSTLGDY